MTYDVTTPSDARLWQYGPDFSRGFELRRSFLTDIAVSRNNSEQRRALRDIPRLSAGFRTFVKDGDYRDAKHFLRAWQNKPSAVPDWSRYVLTTGASSGGGSALTIAAPPAWIAAGQLLALIDCDNAELVEVDSVAAPTITLTDTLTNNWPAGSVVRPVLFGLLDGALRSSRLTRGAAEIDVEVAAYPGGEPPENEGTAAVTFNGYEVFMTPCSFAGNPGIDYIWPVEQVDFGIGRTAQFRPIDRGEQLMEAEFDRLTASDVESIVQVFLRAKGMRGAFYRPSGEKDMVLAGDASGTQIDVEGTALAADFGSIDYGANDVALEIIQTNGTRLHRLITAIAANFGNSRITLSSAVTVTVATTARISWMPLSRFASDDLVTVWKGGANGGSIRTSFQTVKQ